MFWGLAASLLLIASLILQNWKRSRLQVVEDLVPNRLLTRYPLLFIPGKRSLFYFLGYWNQIPHWLASHGYEVFHFALPWKNTAQRKNQLHRFLMKKSQSGEHFHLFLDSSSFREISHLLENHSYDCLASVTLIGERHGESFTLSSRLSQPIEELQLPENQSARPFFWILHQLSTAQKLPLSQLGWNLNRLQGELLLERTQFLAERDLLQRPRSPNLET